MLEGLAVGDRVRFTAERIDGQYTVTALSKAP
ncbi:MAG TPA: copper-binding protein [Rubrivivax sp.]|nr:copper-binding protein [Rubrivivax sp.]